MHILLDLCFNCFQNHICACTGSFASTPVGLEHRSFVNSDLSWTTVPKRNRSGTRRNRKPVAKSFTMGLGLANKKSRQLENVTDSEPEKLGVDVLGQRFSEKVENVPIKKRWFMFRSLSPPPPVTSCPHLEPSEEHVEFQTASDQNRGSSAKQWQQHMKSDCSVKSYAPSTDDEKISEVINGVTDLPGIEILEAAACSDSFCNNVTEYDGNPIVEESTQERIQSSLSSIHFEETIASMETLSCFPKDSVNERKSEGSSFQDNSFAVLHELPINTGMTSERAVPLREFPSGKGTDLSVNESKPEGSSFQDKSFSVLRVMPNDKDTTPERLSPLPDDKLLWDLNVSVDAWPCDGGNVDSQMDSFDNTTVRSKELQTTEPQDIKIDTTNEVVSSDVDGGNGMTSKLSIMPAETDYLDTEKQESDYGSQDIIDGSQESVVDECNRMISDFRSMPPGTDVLRAEEQESGCNSRCIKKDTTKVVVSSDFDWGISMTSELRIMPVDVIDMSIEEQESEGCSGFDSNLLAQEPQDMENGTSIAVVSSDVDGGNGMTSDLITIPPVTDRSSTKKQESEGCSGYDSQFEDGKLRESDVEYCEEAEQVDYDTEFEEERSFGLEAESGEQEVEVERRSKTELTESSKFCKTGEALVENSESLKIRTMEVSDGETMKFDCLDRANYDLRVDLSKESEKELLYCVEGSSSSDVQKSMSDNFNGSYPRTERGAVSDKFMWSDRSSQMPGRSPERAQFFSPSANYCDSSKREHQHIYHGTYNFERPGSESAFGNQEYPMGTDQASSDDAGVARPVHRITRSDSFNGSYPRTKRVSGSDKFVRSDRSSHMRGRSPESAQFYNHSANFWVSSKRENPHMYDGPYNFGRPRSKCAFGNREYPVGTDQVPSDAAGVARPDHRMTRQFMDSHQPILRRRSPIERDEFYNMHPRRATVKDTVRDFSTDRNRFRRYPQRVNRGIRDEYFRHVPDDSTQYRSRIPHYLDRRERSISPHVGRPHHAVHYKRARSRSRSRSPSDWLLQRDPNDDSRRCDRSPGFRSDARIDAVRLPFTKRFATGYEEFISPPRGRASLQRNSRMFEDRNPGLDHVRGPKSNARMQKQRFDQARPIRRLNSDYFNPMIRRRRFPDGASGGKGCNYEVSEDM